MARSLGAAGSIRLATCITASVSGVLPDGEILPNRRLSSGSETGSATQATSAGAEGSEHSAPMDRHWPCEVALSKWKSVRAPSVEASSAIPTIVSDSSVQREVFTGVSRPALLGTSRVPSFMFIEPLLSTTQKRTGNATVLSISSLESPRGKPRPAIARHAASSLPGQSLVPAGGALDA